jgi:hypothetical protein
MKETADYAARVKALREEQQRLERKQVVLLEKRRTEIGRLAEKLGVLEIDDDALAGALLELKTALDTPAGQERLKHWRSAGTSFRRGHKDSKPAASRAGAAPEESNQHEARS